MMHWKFSHSKNKDLVMQRSTDYKNNWSGKVCAVFS